MTDLSSDIDFGVEAHWKYDVRDAIDMTKAIAPANPAPEGGAPE